MQDGEDQGTVGGQAGQDLPDVGDDGHVVKEGWGEKLDQGRVLKRVLEPLVNAVCLPNPERWERDFSIGNG